MGWMGPESLQDSLRGEAEVPQGGCLPEPLPQTRSVLFVMNFLSVFVFKLRLESHGWWWLEHRCPSGRMSPGTVWLADGWALLTLYAGPNMRWDQEAKKWDCVL